jgi:hypothetical protein
LIQSIILLQYIFGTGNVEKEHHDFTEYYKGLATEQKQKLDPGLVLTFSLRFTALDVKV